MENTQDSQKVCTKLLSLPDNAKKLLIFSPSAKIKMCTLSKAQHTHKIRENFTYGIVLGPLLIPAAAIGKCKQANEFELHEMATQPH